MKTVAALVCIASVSLASQALAATTCTPTTLGFSPYVDPSALATDDTSVYWVRAASACGGGYEIVRTPKSGGAEAIVANGQSHPSALTDAGGRLAWFDSDPAGGQRIVSASTSGGSTVVLVAADPCHYRGPLALDGRFVYWADTEVGARDAQLFRAPLDGSAAPVMLGHWASTINQLETDGSSMYVTTQDIGIDRVPIDGGTPQPMLGPLTGGVRFALNATQIFFISQNTIFSLPKAGGTFAPLYQLPLTGNSWLFSLAASNNRIAWVQGNDLHATYSPQPPLQVATMAADGSGLQMLAADSPSSAVATDDGAVYDLLPNVGPRRLDVTCAMGASGGATSSCVGGTLGPSDAFIVGSDTAALYAVSGSSLVRIPKDGSTTTTLGGGVTYTTPIIVDDSGIFVSDGNNVTRVHKDGSGADTLFGSSATALFVDSSSLFFVSGGNAYTVPKSGGTATPVAAPNGMSLAAVDDAAFYFLAWQPGLGGWFGQGSGQLYKQARSGGALVELNGSLTGRFAPVLAAVDATRLYFVSTDAAIVRIGRVYSVDKANGAIITYASQLANGVAQDDTYLYISQAWDPGQDPPSYTQIARVRKDGAGGAYVYADNAGARGVAADSSWVYVGIGAGPIHRVAPSCGACAVKPAVPVQPPVCPPPNNGGGGSPDGGVGDGGVGTGGGSCAPALVTTTGGINYHYQLQAGAKSLYYAYLDESTEVGSIMEVDQQGGTSAAVAPLGWGSSYPSFISDDNAFYVAEGNTLWARQRGGVQMPLASLAAGSGGWLSMTQDATYVYFVDGDPTHRTATIKRAPKSGTGPTDTLASSGELAFRITRVDGDLYWLTSSTLYRLPAGATSPIVVADGVSGSAESRFAVLGDFVYVDAHGLAKAPKTGGHLTIVAGRRPDFTDEHAWAIRAVGGVVYWMAESQSGEYREQRMMALTADGATREVMPLDASVFHDDVVVTADAIFWHRSSGKIGDPGQIYRQPWACVPPSTTPSGGSTGGSPAVPPDGNAPAGDPVSPNGTAASGGCAFAGVAPTQWWAWLSLASVLAAFAVARRRRSRSRVFHSRART
jgi:hypothetical protein